MSIVSNSSPLISLARIGKRNLLAAMEILEQEGIAWFGVDTTSYRITFLTEETELDRTVRRLHARFIETAVCESGSPQE